MSEEDVATAAIRCKKGEYLNNIAKDYDIAPRNLYARLKSLELDYKPTIHDRFLNNTNTIPYHSCWEWSSSIGNHGYGVFNNTLAHRYSYSYHIGDIPKGLHVLHTCDNKSCVNPDHLFLGTNNDNIEDKLNKGRQAKWENAGSSKLSNAEVIEIKEKLKKGETHENIAKCFNVHPTTITCINTNKTWKELQ